MQKYLKINGIKTLCTSLKVNVDNGILCTYDGLIDSKGEVVFDTSFYYTKPTLDLLNDSLDYGNIISKEIDSKLKEYGRKIVKEFGIEGKIFISNFQIT